MTIEPESLLTVTGLSKTFQGHRALESVDFEIRKGEVHALVGQNGSGKSTLIKILAGYHQPDSGSVAVFAGVPIELGTVARPSGLRFVHQDLGLIHDLNATDNLALGDRYTRRFWLSDRREERAALEILADFGVEIDPSAPIGYLSATLQTMLALVRSARRTIEDQTNSLLVLDEVTSSLPAQAVRQLFKLINELRDRGTSILYVTHRLGEVFEIADRVTVLRDGRPVSTCDVGAISHSELVELLVGRPLDTFYPEPPPPRSDLLLQVSPDRRNCGP